jgi:hypothetical protein
VSWSIDRRLGRDCVVAEFIDNNATRLRKGFDRKEKKNRSDEADREELEDAK